MQWQFYACKSLLNWHYAMTESTQFTVCNDNLLCAMTVYRTRSQFSCMQYRLHSIDCMQSEFTVFWTMSYMQESAQLAVCNGRAYSFYCMQSHFIVCILNLMHVTQSTINLLYAMTVYSIYCIQWYCHVCKSLLNWLYAMTEPTQITVCNLNLLYAISIYCMQYTVHSIYSVPWQ